MSAPFDETPEHDDDEPRRVMLPRSRSLRSGPPQAIPLSSETDWEDEDADEQATAPRRATRQDLDPVFGYIMAMSLSVGLTPIQPNMRYVILWGVLTLMGGTAFLLGSGIRFKVSDPGNLLWGLVLGVFTGGALMMVGADTLKTTTERLFAADEVESALLDTWVFQATVFVMPIAETLFFRGAMQRTYSVPVVSLLASIWSMLMFFPNLGLGETPIVGMVFGMALVLLNFLYSYVHERNGIAAAFLCQITAGSLLLLVPLLVY